MRFLLSVFVAALAIASAARAESIFPLGKAMAEGRTLPPPYSVTATYYWQEQDYEIAKLAFAVPGFALPPTLNSENKSSSWLVQPGVWLLPFVHVYGVLGRVENETLVSGIPIPGSETIRVDAHGTVRGGGLFIAGAWEAWFAGVSASLTDTDLNVRDGSIRTFNLSPRAGRTFSWGALWLGGNYLDSSEKSQGVFPLPPGFPLPISSVAYAVELAPSAKWNAAAGARYEFNRHLDFTLEFGFIERTSVRVASRVSW